MKRYERFIAEGLRLFDTFYAEEKNKETVINTAFERARKCGYTNIRCVRVRTDTKGLLMFELWVNKEK